MLPAVVVASPTFKAIPPDSLSILDPVFIINPPDAPVLAVPVLISTDPLELASPPFGVLIDTAPLACSVLLPLRIEIIPPVNCVLEPAPILTSPPLNFPAEAPTESVISPLLPSVDAPVLSDKLPELAKFADPVDIATFPLAPASPAFEDKILIDPLPAAVLPPLRTEISPPLF